MINENRTRCLNNVQLSTERSGPVLYWMDRDQRVADNWALLYAQQIAIEHARPLEVVFCSTPELLGVNDRQCDFMLAGLMQLEQELQRHGIPFVLVSGNPETEILSKAIRCDARAVVTDFSPLRLSRNWRQQVASELQCPLFEVDAHNIVPCWLASDKREYAAYTFRPKVNRQLPEYLTEFPRLLDHPVKSTGDYEQVSWDCVRSDIGLNGTTLSSGFGPGEKVARRKLRKFLGTGVKRYADNRNDPNARAQSGLSPYLHFGQLSAQRIALEIQEACDPADAEVFLEELIVRRELSDNFCHYCAEYDSAGAFPDWARKTLAEHRSDPRPYLYTSEQLEDGETHDPLWNAAQKDMFLSSRMPGYLRMYWAKKILEWSVSPEEALSSAIYLNDKFSLDGNDPNGYAGIAWSIGGVHDRAWSERDVFGKVRYMSHDGCRRKFDVAGYMRRVSSPEIEAHSV